MIRGRMAVIHETAQPAFPAFAAPEYTVHEGDGMLRGKRSIRGSFPSRAEAREAAARLVAEGVRMAEVRQSWGLLDTYVSREGKPRRIYEAMAR